MRVRISCCLSEVGVSFAAKSWTLVTSDVEEHSLVVGDPWDWAGAVSASGVDVVEKVV
jgi:hypothetical protein